MTDALQNLKERGYFNLANICLKAKINLTLHPEQCAVIKFYRFEGMTNPTDSKVVYAMKSGKNIKEVQINVYGIYTHNLS